MYGVWVDHEWMHEVFKCNSSKNVYRQQFVKPDNQQTMKYNIKMKGSILHVV